MKNNLETKNFIFKFSKKAGFLIGPKIDLTNKENYCYKRVRLNLAILTVISLTLQILKNAIFDENWNLSKKQGKFSLPTQKIYIIT